MSHFAHLSIANSWTHALIFAMVCLAEFLLTTTMPVQSARNCTGQSLAAAALWRTVSSPAGTTS